MLKAPNAWKRPTLQYSLLAVLFLITAASLVYRIDYALGYMSGRIFGTRDPFGVSASSPVVEWARDEVKKAGIQPGDTVLALEGVPCRGRAVVTRALAQASPGRPLAVTIKHKGQTSAATVRVPLVPRTPGTFDRLFTAMLGIVLPVFSVLLGFWVALVRPRDPLAWLLMALLLGFASIFTIGGEALEGTAVSNTVSAFKQLCYGTWFIWLLLLGLKFPTPLAAERRAPWLKWLLIVPLGAGAVLADIYGLRLNADFSFAKSSLARLLDRFGPAYNLLMVATVVLFFGTLCAKMFLERSPDAKRRLRLFYAGTFLALAPGLVLIVVSRFSDKGLGDYADWLIFPCLLVSLLFPLTLAYLIVVHRALDVRVVIRQSLQYALARGGVTVLQGVLIAALVTAISFVIASRRMPLLGTVTLIALGIVAISQLRRAVRPLAAWIDRRFFREAYNAELLLADLGEKVRTMIETRPLVEMVARRISESLHVPRIAVLLEAFGPYQPAYALGYDGPLDVALPEGGILRHLRQRKEPARVYLDDERSWIHTLPDVSDEERRGLERLQTELLLPLMVRERLLGVISLSQKKSEEAYSGSDVRLLSSVAAQAAMALENARLTAAIADEVAQRERLNRELEIAREVQEHLFPTVLPPIDGLDYAGACRPALGVGGDYYDFIELPGGKLGVAIGDVSGKGISAALVMSSLQAALRSQTMTGAGDLAGIVSRIHTLVYQASTASRYATFFFAEYDPASGELRYVNAGHNAPMVFREVGTVDRLEAGGPVIGLLKRSTFQEASVVLQPGDLLVAFTDGISETMNAADEEWGEDALVATVRAAAEMKACDLLQRIMRAADAFAAGAPQHDDMTLVVMRRAG